MRSFVLALTLIAALLVACSPQTTPMTPDEAKRVETLTAKMTPRCVGRFLLDLPAAFVLNSQSSTEIEGVKVDVVPMDKRLFEMELEAREISLNRTKFFGSRSDLPFLRTKLELPAPSIGVVFDRAESEGTSRLSRTLELLGWRDGFRVKAVINATDNTFPENANDTIAKQLGKDTPEKLAKLLNIYERVRGRQLEEIPAEAGFCIPNAFVKGPTNEHEEVAMVFHLEASRDVFFSFAAINDASKESESLLQRSSQVEREMGASGSKTLRKGRRKVHEQEFEEWLMKGPTPFQVPGTMFTLMLNETEKGALKPFTRLELLNGFEVPAPPRSAEESAQVTNPQRASLSEAEALVIWEQVTSTLRVRPGAF